MSDTKVILRKNSLNLPTEQIVRIEKALERRDISPISSDKETGLFLLYAMGESLDSIAEQTNIPKDIIALTAVTYDWETKCLEIKKYRNGDKIGEMQKDLVNTLLAATYVTIKRELALVIAGKKDPYEVLLIPKKIEGLEKLMNMVAEINSPGATAAKNTAQKAGGTVVQAQNVQINQQVVTNPDSAQKESKVERLRKLREEL
ncbi:MAG: hypothetical protein QXL01_01575 [Thermoplasmatales archaeon]